MNHRRSEGATLLSIISTWENHITRHLPLVPREDHQGADLYLTCPYMQASRAKFTMHLGRNRVSSGVRLAPHIPSPHIHDPARPLSQGPDTDGEQRTPVTTTREDISQAEARAFLESPPRGPSATAPVFIPDDVQTWTSVDCSHTHTVLMQDAGGNMQAPQCSTSVQVTSANNTPKPTNISHSVQADTRTSPGGVQGPGSNPPWPPPFYRVCSAQRAACEVMGWVLSMDLRPLDEHVCEELTTRVRLLACPPLQSNTSVTPTDSEPTSVPSAHQSLSFTVYFRRSGGLDSLTRSSAPGGSLEWRKPAYRPPISFNLIIWTVPAFHIDHLLSPPDGSPPTESLILHLTLPTRL
ncbi:uncharacterized protein CLUP02_04810 [Colletotrichum lupini]|uniref:Uncharacterized protein n=1 Tax=Colletotrichum lupini TaxID=145971 RepID=A0A9Q8SM36_9PEZI|nr:uncharacterized protein CLUP02_04810 [Colletotrichum lupini]UQC79331.1 hypothetical protein CLUP02_04810 [Colletotrichum lupini]